jgi:ribosomal protein S18 acetylase RimI-like enzyme
VQIRPLDPATDAEACDAIVASLPEWFGLEEGIREAADLVRSAPGSVAVRDGQVVGFETHAERSFGASEITWIAVHTDHRGSGIGSALVEELASSLRSAGVALLVVKTLSDRVDPGPEYAATRAFYLARGFIPVQELDIWGPDNAAQLLVKPLG